MLVKLLYFYLFKALIITIITEELCLVILRERRLKVYIICLKMNILTNVSMNILLQYAHNYYLSLVILEIIVFLVEGIIYFIVTRNLKLAILYALVCNLSSLSIGVLI